jgi:signal transduction histidine kinase
VLENLVVNTLEHGATEEPVRVTSPVPGRARDDRAGEPLILPDLLGQIVEPFRRGATGDIVGQILAAHRGAIVVSSTAENRTRFAVTLPRGV